MCDSLADDLTPYRVACVPNPETMNENGNGKLETFVPRETQNLKWSVDSTHWPKDAGPLQVRSLLDDLGQVPSVSLIRKLILTGFSTF